MNTPIIQNHSVAGIDYGRNQTCNRDSQTGIRYGVISKNSVNPDALGEVYSNGDDLGYLAAKEEAQSILGAAIREIFGYSHTERIHESDEFKSAWDAIEQEWSDAVSMSGVESGPYLYERDGLRIRTTDLGLFIELSPYVAQVKFCSPCCPGAGDLDNPVDGGVLAYCLPLGWFDADSPCPYSPVAVADLK